MCPSTPKVPKPIPPQEIKQPDTIFRRQKTAQAVGAGGPGAGGPSLMAGSLPSLAAGATTTGATLLGS